MEPRYPQIHVHTRSRNPLTLVAAIREELLDKQTPDGYWQGQAGNEYGTAMALIILQIPNRLLPIFQQ